MKIVMMPKKIKIFNRSFRMHKEIIETDKMDNVSKAVISHLQMKTAGALLLTGDWGCGKTYHVKNVVFPLVESETGRIPIIVSLYGKTDISSVVQEVIFSFLNQKGKSVEFNMGTIVKNVKGLSDSVPFIKKYIDVNKFITGAGGNLFKLLPSDKVFICFDDLERISSNLDIDEILGVINDLVENKGCKVLVIANESRVDKIRFKEKAIEKTILFSPDMSLVYDNIIDGYEESDFKSYMLSEKESILISLTPSLTNENENIKLKEDLSNIRTIKFAIEHFKQCFEKIVDGDLDELLLLKQLKNLWVFILSVSCEYKKTDGLSYEEKGDLDVQVDAADVISDWSSESIILEEDPVAINFDSEKFKRFYYHRLSEEYIFYPEVYDFITGGAPVIKEDFIKTLNDRFKVIEGNINPAHELLQTFLRGYWLYSDEEYPTKLKELLNFVEKGEYKDLISFLNAGIYLTYSASLFRETKETIITKMKVALDLSINEFCLNELYKTQYNLQRANFIHQGLEELIKYIDAKIVEVEDFRKASSFEVFKDDFVNDIESSLKKLLPDENGIGHMGSSVYHKLPKETIDSALSQWNSKAIMNFISLLNVRYIESGFIDQLIEERSFLDMVEECIEALDLDNNVLSVLLIKEQLLPLVKKCKLKFPS